MVHVAVLPIELVSLEAVSDEGRAGLHWATASESNYDQFNVLRSSNAVDWSSIGTVEGMGNSSSLVLYELAHHETL
jgi:hypothetical protein